MSDTKTVVLPGSGREVTIRRPPLSHVSLVIAFQTNNPKPRPPMQEIKIMGRLEWVENLAHPDYAPAVQEWQNGLATMVTAALLNYGVIDEPTDEDRARIEEARLLLGPALRNVSDHEVFIRHVLIQSDEDFNELAAAIRSMSQPTEAQIADHAAGFRRKV